MLAVSKIRGTQYGSQITVVPTVACPNIHPPHLPSIISVNATSITKRNGKPTTKSVGCGASCFSCDENLFTNTMMAIISSADVSVIVLPTAELDGSGYLSKSCPLLEHPIHD